MKVSEVRSKELPVEESGTKCGGRRTLFLSMVLCSC